MTSSQSSSARNQRTQPSLGWVRFLRDHGWSDPWTSVSFPSYDPVSTLDNGLTESSSPLWVPLGTQRLGPSSFPHPVYIASQGTCYLGAHGPSLELWWRRNHETIRRPMDCLSTLTLDRPHDCPESLVLRWADDDLTFLTTYRLVQLGTHASLLIQATLTTPLIEPTTIQLIGALRPFSLSRPGVLSHLKYHTTGLLLSDGFVILHDLGEPIDGIRLGSAKLGDVRAMLEGTIPPEGGLSLNDLHKGPQKVFCSLGLATGALSTVSRVSASRGISRTWLMPLEKISLSEYPVELARGFAISPPLARPQEFDSPTNADSITARSGQDYRYADPVSTSPSTIIPESLIPGSSWDQASWFFYGGMSLSRDPAGHGKAWQTWVTGLVRLDKEGLMTQTTDPLYVTACWLAGIFAHLTRVAYPSGARAPFPPDYDWARIIRRCALKLTREMRRRDQLGWIATRINAEEPSAFDHATLARTIFALDQFWHWREIFLSHQEAVAFQRLEQELRSILRRSLARTQEHQRSGLIPGAEGIRFGPGSLAALEALAALDGAPVASTDQLQKNAEHLFLMAESCYDGLLPDPYGLASAQSTLRLALLLRQLGLEFQAKTLIDRIESLFLRKSEAPLRLGAGILPYSYAPLATKPLDRWARHPGEDLTARALWCQLNCELV